MGPHLQEHLGRFSQRAAGDSQQQGRQGGELNPWTLGPVGSHCSCSPPHPRGSTGSEVPGPLLQVQYCLHL